MQTNVLKLKTNVFHLYYTSESWLTEIKQKMFALIHLGEENARSFLEGNSFFLYEDTPLLFVPFFKVIETIIWAPRIRTCCSWGEEETEIVGLSDGSLRGIRERYGSFSFFGSFWMRFWAFEWQSVNGGGSGWDCLAHNGCVAGMPGWSAERPGPRSGAPPKVVAELRLITDFALRATKPSKSSLFGTSIEALVRKVQYNIFNTFILFLYPLIVSVLLD